MNSNELENVFTYHKPKDNQVDRYEALRDQARRFADMVMEYCPESREKSTAIAKVREAVMWANAAIAVNE